MAQDTMTTDEVAQLLHTSRPTIYKLVSRGLLKRYERAFGGPGGLRYYFLRSEVEDLAAKTPALSSKTSKRSGRK